MKNINIALKILIVQTLGSQTALARVAFIGESKVSRILNGWTQATPHEKRRIAAALGVAVEHLFGDVASESTAAEHPSEATTV